jgi:hypothetical protein
MLLIQMTLGAFALLVKCLSGTGSLRRGQGGEGPIHRHPHALHLPYQRLLCLLVPRPLRAHTHQGEAAALVLGIWAGLFGPARARLENRSPKHDPARNNIGRASTARRRAWVEPQFPAPWAPGTARIDGSGLGRHGPIKPNLFNFFSLVRYRLYIVVIFGFCVVK